MQKIFLYDGNCNFCSGLKLKIEKICLDKTIQYISFRTLGDAELINIHPNLNIKLCHGNVQYIVGKTRYPGFFAIRKLSHSLKGYRYFSILLYFPFIPLIGILVMNILKSRSGH